jgi:hypothetical protein
MVYAAVDLMAAAGLPAQRLRVGFSEWRRNDLPVEKQTDVAN